MSGLFNVAGADVRKSKNCSSEGSHVCDCSTQQTVHGLRVECAAIERSRAVQFRRGAESSVGSAERQGDAATVGGAVSVLGLELTKGCGVEIKVALDRELSRPANTFEFRKAEVAALPRKAEVAAFPFEAAHEAPK